MPRCFILAKLKIEAGNDIGLVRYFGLMGKHKGRFEALIDVR
jgi:hypothetical protein